MTMWYDEDSEALVENRPDLDVEYVENSRGNEVLHLDLSSDSRKREFVSIAEQVEQALEEVEE